MCRLPTFASQAKRSREAATHLTTHELRLLQGALRRGRLLTPEEQSAWERFAKFYEEVQA
jgi:hypothetical protein